MRSAALWFIVGGALLLLAGLSSGFWIPDSALSGGVAALFGILGGSFLMNGCLMLRDSRGQR